MIGMFIQLLAIILLAATVSAGESGLLGGERVFVVNDYRYVADGSGGDPDQGHAICSVRCNALSVDYRNYIDPGGWRFIKVASDRETTVDPGNPFIGGHCVCTVDEYAVLINDFNKRKAAGNE